MGSPGDGLLGLGDAGLLVCITRRSPVALAEVYRRNSESLYHVATRMCGPADAQGIVVQVLLELWREPERFSPERGSLRALLLARAHRCAVEAARARRRTAVSQPGPPDHHAGVLLAEPGNACAASLLARLADDQREAIARAYLDGNRYDEIATALDLPAAAVTQAMRTGLQRLVGAPPAS